MRTIEQATAFPRDYKRESKGRHAETLDADLSALLVSLASDKPLPVRLRDHALSGDWAGYRECHIRPDLLLIYHKAAANLLRIARLGFHSELFKK